eukprot:2316278-Pyramimonas_sp.AAC.1
MLLEALSFDSDHSCAWKELYEVPGGDLVDGSLSAPLSGAPAKRLLRGIQRPAHRFRRPGR